MIRIPRRELRKDFKENTYKRENYTYNHIERVESLGQVRKEGTENLTLSGHTEGKSESSE